MNAQPPRPYDILADGRPIYIIWATSKESAIADAKANDLTGKLDGKTVTASARLQPSD